MEKELYGWTNATAQGKLMLEEEKQFFKTQYRKLLNMKYELETLGEPMKELKKDQEELKNQLKEKLANEHNNGYLFITINPNDKTKIDHFLKKVIKFIHRNFCDEASAVIEQRGVNETELGKGFHAHIALKRNLNYRPSDIIKGAKNTFKDCCDTKNSALLNIQIIGKDFHKDKLEYINGIKTGEGKSDKQIMDRLYRKNNNIDIVYNALKQIDLETS